MKLPNTHPAYNGKQYYECQKQRRRLVISVWFYTTLCIKGISGNTKTDVKKPGKSANPVNTLFRFLV